ncbi:acyl-CoA thioesterase [Aquibacillus kalidii]|uniref:acyl-CoA thioesterase n=1 Tax=Aquibacillus kalidii TaxID=2762597 RepID=UPI001647985B|nr:thioesterase family protein [Aquibacillus kalidii]
MKSIDYITDVSQWKDEFTFHIPIKIRFAETDMFGHVNNVFVFMYLEEARVDYLKQIGLFQDFSNDMVPIVVADLQCNYLKQIYFTDHLSVFVKMASVGETSFDLHYMGENAKGEVCFTARGRMVQIDPITGKSKRFSSEVKRQLLEMINPFNEA